MTHYTMVNKENNTYTMELITLASIHMEAISIEILMLAAIEVASEMSENP